MQTLAPKPVPRSKAAPSRISPSRGEAEKRMKGEDASVSSNRSLDLDSFVHFNLSQVSVLHSPLQRKPMVSVPSDPLEREAEVAADEVMRTTEHATMGGSPVASELQRGRKDQRGNTTVLSRAPASAPWGDAMDLDNAIDTRAAIRATAQGGTQLPTAVRSYFEPRFGHDFSRVRVHHDQGAADGAQAVRARAYTVGSDIVFGADEYRPTTEKGRHLLAHELAHVVQQAKGGGASAALSGPVVQRAVRPDESSPNFEAMTQVVLGDSFDVIPEGKTKKESFTKQFAVFVPAGAAAEPDTNNVHLFFTPFFPAPVDYVRQQGLRSQSDNSHWILIGVPARMERDQPNFVTISTAEISKCLSAVKRKKPDAITAIRLSAHSRGHRGLEHTIGGFAGNPPTIDLGLVERVSVFDASYQDLGNALSRREKDLTRMQDPKHTSRFAGDSIRLYDATVGNISNLPGISLDPTAMQGLAYVRFLQEAIARKDLTTADLSMLPKDIKAATDTLLKLLPVRGLFSTRNPLPATPAGLVDLPKFLAANKTELRLVSRKRDGLKDFLSLDALDGGQPWGNDAHHWLAAELAHEATD